MNKYFYIDKDNNQKGPFDLYKLREEPINKQTYVWTEGMEAWQPAGQLRALDFLFTGNEPPFFTQPSPKEMKPDVPMPDTWLTKSILVTLLPFILCSSPLSLVGIIAVVNAAKVESLYLAGNIKESLRASATARKWTKITFWISIGWVLILILVIILAFTVVGFSSITDAFHTASIF